MQEEKTPQEQKGVQEDSVVTEGKVYGIIAYIGILCLIPLLLKKENSFALHHGKQGLVIFIAEVICGVLVVIPILGLMLFPLMMLLLSIISIIGIVQAALGNYWRCPVIADLADKINI